MFKISLRVARELSGYTAEEAAGNCGIPIYTLNKFETDSGQMPIKLISKILSLYKISSSLIFFGTIEDCIKHNHNRITQG